MQPIKRNDRTEEIATVCKFAFKSLLIHYLGHLVPYIRGNANGTEVIHIDQIFEIPLHTIGNRTTKTHYKIIEDLLNI